MKFNEDVPLSNLFVTMLNRVGIETGSFVDSNGEITDLTV